MEMETGIRRRSQPTLGSNDDPATSLTVPSQQRPERVVPVSSAKVYFLQSRSTIITALLVFVVSIVSYISYEYDPWYELRGSKAHKAAREYNASLEYRRPLDLILNPSAHRSRAPRYLHHNWTVTSEIRHPDGVAKRVYLINGMFPGPTLEARSGDTIVIDVLNSLEDEEAISIHWHGLHMRKHIQYDGATGFTQCPIAPGTRLVYEIPINNQHGTFWYHAHEQVQRADGLYGALIVHEPAHETFIEQFYDEERVLMIGDWYHRPADEVLKWYMRAGSKGMEPVPDSLVVNGLGTYNCSLAVPARPVDCTRIHSEHFPFISSNTSCRYRYRIINTGSLAGINLRFPGASLTPITVDGDHPINIQDRSRGIGVIHPGERVDVLVSWRPTSQQRKALHITLDDDSFRYPNLALAPTHTYPIIISGPPSSSEPKGPSTIVRSSIDIQLARGVRLATSLQPQADQTLMVYTTTLKLSRLSNIPYGFMNHTSHKRQSSPNAPLITLPRAKWDINQFVPFVPYRPPSAPLYIDLVINNLDDGGHPFHLHGYDFYVLSTYAADLSSTMSYGSWNPFDESMPPPGGPMNLVNPVKKDTVFVPRRGYVVLRFLADNPGIWMLHCHLLWHQASGMAMGLQVGVDEGYEGLDWAGVDGKGGECEM